MDCIEQKLTMNNLRFPLASTILWAVAQLIVHTPVTAQSACPPPALSRLKSHQITAGETVESIASQYNLIPATLVELNPSLRGGSMPVGSTILIPPFNGIRVQTTEGASWKDLAATYGVRADILFEVNGCQQQPQQVFIPGVNFSSSGERPARENYTGFPGYPLPSVASIGLSYGWRQNLNPQQSKFHGGVDLLADPGTSVQSVDAGTVAFAGEQGSYGNLVVVNHQGGRQTRYAHLSSISVSVGQLVQTGDILGTVGSTGNPDINQSHLHFEVRQNSPLGWVAQDPQLHLQAKPTAQR